MYLNVAHDFTQYFIKLDGDSWINLENFPEIQGAGRGGPVLVGAPVSGKLLEMDFVYSFMFCHVWGAFQTTFIYDSYKHDTCAS